MTTSDSTSNSGFRSALVTLLVAVLLGGGMVGAFVLFMDEPAPTVTTTRVATTTEPQPSATEPGEPEVDPSTGFVKAKDWELAVRNCTACHSAKLVTQNRGDREHWKSMIRWMQETQNLWPLAPEIESRLLDYLATHYGARTYSRRPPLPAHLMPPDPAEKTAQASDRVKEAQAALAPLKQQLMGALKAALDEGGPVKAIDVCQLKAPEIAATASGAKVKVGRTSHKLRSAKNAPREWMKPLLDEYAKGPKAPGSFKTVALPEGGLGYVEPIYVQAMCLRCHGAELSPEVASALEARYPDDRATGFHEGDFRGLFWVELLH